MTIIERNALAAQIGAWHVARDHRVRAATVRVTLARWVKRARRLSDSDLVRIARSIARAA